jgi:23S rRNA (uracil1939-C5)-methyltransferase
VVVVERLAAGGDGVGHVGEKVVFVPYAAPGDLAEIEIVEDRKTWCRARLVRVLRPSPDRVDPPCPVFGACGGCDWQHLAYPAQLAAKRAIVEDALRRIGRLAPPPAAPTLASPRAYGYRHRARLHAAHRRGATRFGFFRSRSHDVVAVDDCPVLHPGLAAVLRALGDAARRHPADFAAVAEVRADADWEGKKVRVTLRGADEAPLALAPAAAAALVDAAAAAGVRALLGDAAAEPLALGPGADALETTGETFTQINLGQNAALVAAALDAAAIGPGAAVLDLFCGLGNLSLPAAARGARVLGVDLDGPAVAQAEANARRLGRDASFVRGDAAAVARELAGAGRRFDVVLLNPPRAGARAAVEAVAALAPARVVMVSCDPATLARDAAALAAAGLPPAALAPVDLFPQTAHVETVARFAPAG